MHCQHNFDQIKINTLSVTSVSRRPCKGSLSDLPLPVTHLAAILTLESLLLSCRAQDQERASSPRGWPSRTRSSVSREPRRDTLCLRRSAMPSPPVSGLSSGEWTKCVSYRHRTPMTLHNLLSYLSGETEDGPRDAARVVLARGGHVRDGRHLVPRTGAGQVRLVQGQGATGQCIWCYPPRI